MRTTYGYREIQQQLQRWEADVLKLQQVWTRGQRVLEEERKRNEEMFQM